MDASLLELYNSPGDLLSRLEEFCSHLTFDERKSLITLARSQSIPDDPGSTIWSKTRPILDALVKRPPFTDLSQELSEFGKIVVRLVASPLTTGLLIVYALGVELSDEEASKGKIESFNKELLATQTIRRETSWNWESFLYMSPHESDIVVHPLFPRLTYLQRSFAPKLVGLESRYRNKVILPHYSRRGVSSETADYLNQRLPSYRIHKRFKGPSTTFHRNLKKMNVTSLDVVHHYVRTGDWVRGRTQLKQRWYPSGLLPRTYFSWGGDAIAISGYLRNFFNDLGDCFEPTHRKNRVQPDWLQHPCRRDDNGFTFYDLKSFTSWFHEQVAFLECLSDRFDNLPVYLSGFDLSISRHTVGGLIDAYIRELNDLPTFYVENGTQFGLDRGQVEFLHCTAGFLGVPGNLITCTLAHGLAQASLQTNPRHLQVPGDDVGAAHRNFDHKRDIGLCASTLGSLQFDKVYHLPEVSVYLKRLVVDLWDKIDLAPMLIYPLLPYLLNPTKDNHRSNRFRLPKPDELLPRAARVLTAFMRDLWKMTGGVLNRDAEEIILIFLRRVHDMVGLPYGPIFQGRLYGIDDGSEQAFPDLQVKFSVESDDCLRRSPDIEFASKHVHSMVIRLTSEVPITPEFNALKAGETVVVKRRRAWTYLEDMGYVRIVGIPGEKVTLIGSDARQAFLYASEPPLREVEVLADLSTAQLVGAGVLDSGNGWVFDAKDGSDSRHTDLNTTSWRYRKYVDLDDPRASGLYGRSREWVVNELSSTRESLSPEPFTTTLDY